MPETYLSVTQAAARLDCSAVWLRRLCQRGDVPATKVGAYWTIREKDIPRARAVLDAIPRGRPK